jgi:colicin import membrane protein
MSPSLQAAMDGWFQDKFQGCWIQPVSLPQGPKYVPQIRVQLNLDGSLAADPVLTNPPDDPAWQPLADSAVRAVHTCDPLPVPDKFKAYYDTWRDRVVQFEDQDESQ